MTTDGAEHTVPRCLGIIMDGNRRWARAHGLPTLEGHRRGYKKLDEALTWCKDAGIRHLVVYALSTENWNRSPEEVAYLMDLFREMSNDLRKRVEQHAAVHFIGDLARFPEDVQRAMERTHADNPPEATHHLWVAASYGGRPEILAAVNALIAQGVGSVDEATFATMLWSAGMPDPDLIIRTGGDKRLSNFLTWSSVYSELSFVDTCWPAFAREEFDAILTEFGKRKRRFGR